MYELQVEGMSCSHCVGAVTRSVHEVDTEAKVEVDLAQQKVRVQSTAPLKDIESAISDAGYPVLHSVVS
ncbi:MAG: heavy-metal-associated domain-containing protein [Noviherbaspirillum sp.]